jgi:NTE family protein
VSAFVAPIAKLKSSTDGSACFRVVASAIFVGLTLLQGCASRPINEPIAHVEPESGYRVVRHVMQRPGHDRSTLLVLAFSGGGTRAAAFSYGVLEELRRTPVVIDGHQRRMLDEVDIITSVSGGSFTALAYALYGDRLFSEYETRFLKRNVQGELIRRAINPFGWPKLLSPGYGRSELAADYYDEILFDGATFADLITRPTPVAMPSATDLVTGDRFPFEQDNFNLICSNLTTVRLSRAAAASSAVPVVLSPVTFNNYGGHCGFEFPAWIQAAFARRNPDLDTGRALQRYEELVDLQDSAARPFLHLVDGGISDNVAVRAIVELLETVDVSRRLEAMPLLRDVRRIAIIVVNAVTSPNVDWGRIETAPGLFDQLWQASSVPIDRYSYESINLLNDMISRWALERRLAIAEARLAGAKELAEELSRPPIELYVIEVSFRDIADPEERRYFANLPTSFVLSPEAVDGLRDVAGRVLRASQAYHRLVQALGGIVSESSPDASQ